LSARLACVFSFPDAAAAPVTTPSSARVTTSTSSTSALRSGRVSPITTVCTGIPAAPAARISAYCRHAQPNGFGAKDWVEECAVEARWKLVRKTTGATVVLQLFDLVADPAELTNLYPGSTQEQADAIAALTAVLNAGTAGPP